MLIEVWLTGTNLQTKGQKGSDLEFPGCTVKEAILAVRGEFPR